jgi:glycosyltransferase involved in cell wall biosynthesis
MKNILVIHQSAELYGSDKTLLVLLSKLDRQKFMPIVILPSYGPLKDKLENEGITVVITPVLKLYRQMFSPKNMYKLFKGYKEAIKTLNTLHAQYKFDLVYSNTLAVLLGMLFAKKQKLKHVWHVHEIIVHPNLIANTFAYLLNKYATVVVSNSYATQNNLTMRQKGLDAKCVVVHNGLDNEGEGVALSGQKELFGFKEHDIIITLVGRISRFKGHKWLLNTYIKNFKGSNVKLLFAGSPVPGQEYYQEELEVLINEHRLKDSVILLPFTQNIKAVWAITDIAAAPSTEPEPFGLVALEAMLAKKPVVAANHGGLTEIVVNNTTGILVEPGNEQELAAALQRLVNDANLRNTFGQKGYDRAISQFSQEKYVQGMTNIFEKNAIVS